MVGDAASRSDREGPRSAVAAGGATRLLRSRLEYSSSPRAWRRTEWPTRSCPRRQGTGSPEFYERELEALLVQRARVASQIRGKT